MKPTSLLSRLSLLATFVLLTHPLAAATLIAGWDFTTGTPIEAPGLVRQVFAANIGSGTLYLDGSNGSSAWTSGGAATVEQLTSGSGTVVHTEGTPLSTVTDSPAALVLKEPERAANNGSDANGQSVVIALSMTGYATLELGYAYRRGSQGTFSEVVLDYSTNGTTWQNWTTFAYSEANTSWLIETSPVLSSIGDASQAWLRLTFNGAGTNPSGARSFQLDNLTLHAEAIPEPSVVASVALGLALCWGVRRRVRS